MLPAIYHVAQKLHGAKGRKGAQRGAKGRKGAQRGAKGRKGAQRGAKGRKGAQRGAKGRKGAQRGAKGRKGAQRGAKGRKGAQRGATSAKAMANALCEYQVLRGWPSTSTAQGGERARREGNLRPQAWHNSFEQHPYINTYIHIHIYIYCLHLCGLFWAISFSFLDSNPAYKSPKPPN